MTEQFWQDNDVEASSEAIKDVRSGIPFFTPPTGTKGFKTTRIRILPPRADSAKSIYYLWQATHGMLPGSRRPITCPSRMLDADCPACEAAKAYDRSGNKDAASALWPTWKGLVNIVVLDMNGDPTDDSEVLVWAMPKTLLEDLENQIQGLSREERNITHPTKGRDVLVRRKGKQKLTRYEIGLAPVSTKFQLMEKLAEMHDLSAVYPPIPSATIAGYLKASVDPMDDEDEDEAIEGTFRALPSPADANNPFPPDEEDEDEDEGDDEPEEDDEDEEQPAPTSRRSQTAARDRLAARLG